MSTETRVTYTCPYCLSAGTLEPLALEKKKPRCKSCSRILPSRFLEEVRPPFESKGLEASMKSEKGPLGWRVRYPQSEALGADRASLFTDVPDVSKFIQGLEGDEPYTGIAPVYERPAIVLPEEEVLAPTEPFPKIPPEEDEPELLSETQKLDYPDDESPLRLDLELRPPSQTMDFKPVPERISDDELPIRLERELDSLSQTLSFALPRTLEFAPPFNETPEESAETYQDQSLLASLEHSPVSQTFESEKGLEADFPVLPPWEADALPLSRTFPFQAQSLPLQEEEPQWEDAEGEEGVLAPATPTKPFLRTESAPPAPTELFLTRSPWAEEPQGTRHTDEHRLLSRLEELPLSESLSFVPPSAPEVEPDEPTAEVEGDEARLARALGQLDEDLSELDSTQEEFRFPGESPRPPRAPSFMAYMDEDESPHGGVEPLEAMAVDQGDLFDSPPEPATPVEVPEAPTILSAEEEAAKTQPLAYQQDAPVLPPYFYPPWVQPSPVYWSAPYASPPEEQEARTAVSVAPPTQILPQQEFVPQEPPQPEPEPLIPPREASLADEYSKTAVTDLFARESPSEAPNVMAAAPESEAQPWVAPSYVPYPVPVYSPMPYPVYPPYPPQAQTPPLPPEARIEPLVDPLEPVFTPPKIDRTERLPEVEPFPSSSGTFAYPPAEPAMNPVYTPPRARAREESETFALTDQRVGLPEESTFRAAPSYQSYGAPPPPPSASPPMIYTPSVVYVTNNGGGGSGGGVAVQRRRKSGLLPGYELHLPVKRRRRNRYAVLWVLGVVVLGLLALMQAHFYFSP